MKIYIHPKQQDAFPESVRKSLEKDGHLFIHNAKDLEKADIYVGTSLTKAELEHMCNLKAVFVPKAGIDRLPLEFLSQQSIDVIVSHASAPYVAEHGFALLMALMHRIIELHGELSVGNWNADNSEWYSLKQKNVGILGYGAVGKVFAKMLRSFGANIYVIDRGKALPKYVKKVKTIESLLESSDILVCTLPKCHETIGLINESHKDLLRGKFIVNIGRAEIFDEEMLYDMISANMIAGFASDVWYTAQGHTAKQENRLPSRFPFWSYKNVVISPHCAIHADCGKNACIQDIAIKLLNYCRGNKPSCADLNKGY